MITALLERARGWVRAGKGVQAADALWRSADVTAVTFESGRLKAAGVSQEAGVNLRVIADGRAGLAGTTALAALDDLIERAMQSAGLGEEVALDLPAVTRFPHVATLDVRTRDASIDALTGIGRTLVERLARDGCQVNASVERTVSATEVANSTGGAGRYEATTVAVMAEVHRVAMDDVLMVYDQYVGSALPADADLDRLVGSIKDRLDLAATVVDGPSGALPVVFSPAGATCLFLPLEQALSGKSVVEGVSPLADKSGEQVFDPSLTLVDDATRADGPDSRPFDDEGVPSARLPLIERGVVQGFVYDLETAARARTRSTGHGARSVFGKPHTRYSNLIVGTESERGGGGVAGAEGRWPYACELIVDLRDGLVVDELIGVGQGNVMGGAFSHPVALAYRVVNGEVVGRVKQAAVAGNVYELLKRPTGFGRAARWIGTRRRPAIRVEGVSLAAR